MSRPTDERPAVTADHEDARYDMRRLGVLWLAYAAAARHLVRLLPPVLLIFPPLVLLAVPALLLVVDESSMAVVNGSFALIGPPGPPVLVWSAAVLVASTAGLVVALPATVLLAAGRLTGKHVSTSDALRITVRRLPAMAALLLRSAVVVAAIMAVWYALFVGMRAQIAAYVVMTVLFLLAMPCLLAVAVVMLEGRSATGPILRAYRLAGGATWGTAFTLAFGVVLFPVLATQAVSWAAAGTPLLLAGAASVVALVGVPFQATVIARLFLHRLTERGAPAEFDAIVDGLPGSAPRPIRPVPLLAGLLLPGLLYGGAVLVNPLDLLEVSETVITVSRSGDPDVTVSTEGGRSKPTLEWSELHAMYAGQGGRMVMLMDGSRAVKLLTCADSRCARARLTWAEPEAVEGEYPVAGARLADGRLALTTWAIDDMYQWVWDENWNARLRLMLCDSEACAPAAGDPPLAKVTRAARSRVLALAARPGGGLLLAQLRPIPTWKEEDGFTEVLSVTTCDDPACARRRTQEVARLPGNEETEFMRQLVAAVGPDDRPVVLAFDRHTGSMVVISCDDPACTRTRTGRPLPDESLPRYPDREKRAHAALAIRADGRPLIVYRDVQNDAVKLLDCHDRACAKAGTATLTEPGDHHSKPVLALSRDGRAFVAYQNLDRAQVVIATCTGTRCARTPVARIRHDGDHGLTMALDDRERPVLGWIDATEENEWVLVVTTPLTLR